MYDREFIIHPNLSNLHRISMIFAQCAYYLIFFVDCNSFVLFTLAVLVFINIIPYFTFLITVMNCSYYGIAYKKVQVLLPNHNHVCCMVMYCRRGSFSSHYFGCCMEWDHRADPLSHPWSALHRSRGPAGHHRQGDHHMHPHWPHCSTVM